MSKIYRLIIISIMALIFAIGCSDTNSQSSGGGNITDNSSSGGNGGDGSGGTSSSSSEIINSTMRASASQDNALLYTFFTPAAATNGASLKYNWNFDDNAEETTDTNIINHEFSKYGKSYNVTLNISNTQTNDKENVSMTIPLPKPSVYFACSSAGLDIYCLPNISQQGIMDVEYTWNIYNSSNQQIASLNTTGSYELATYTMPLSGSYTVSLSGTTSKVDGAMEYTEVVEVNQSFNKGSISYSTLSSDKLQYRLRYSAGSTNGEVLNYCWEIDEEINSGKCESDSNYHKGTSSTYDEIMHTFPKYKKAYNIKGYVKDASGANPAVSSAIIYQDLPVVAVSVTGAGLSKKFSPVFTYKPAGNLQYIWSFGDGAQSSEESPEHTYKKSGYYTVTLEVISDKFDTTIGSIKSDDVNININEHISNVVIESSLKSRDKSGEKHIISSPAESTQGALYYTWKIDGTVVSEGENIHTLEYSFPVYGKSYSVSLEVENKDTGDKVIAEPKVITTAKPVAKIVLPAYSTPKTQVQMQAKVYFEDTGEDFILIADNPTYEWYIDGKNENNNNHSIIKTFAATQQVPLDLYFRANNIEGNILKTNDILYVNELNLECSIADDAEDMYGAIISCQIPTNIEGSTSYYYKFSYTEYINGVPTVVEVPATEKTQFQIKLYEEGRTKRYQKRDMELQWYAGVKGQYQYSGINKLSYKAKEPVINRVSKIIKMSDQGYSDSKVNNFIISDEGNIFANVRIMDYSENKYTFKDQFKYMYMFDERIDNVFYEMINFDNAKQYYFFITESNKIYKIQPVYDQFNNVNLDDAKPQLLQGISGKVTNIKQSGYGTFIEILTDNGIYHLDYHGNGKKIFDGSIKTYLRKYLLLENGDIYERDGRSTFTHIMPDKKFSMIYDISSVGGELIAVTDKGEVFSYYYDIYNSGELIIQKIDLGEGIYLKNRVETVYGSRFDRIEGLILIDDKAYEVKYYTGHQIIPYEKTSQLSIKKMQCEHDQTQEGYSYGRNCWLLTNDNQLYVFGSNKDGRLGVGHNQEVTTPEQILKGENVAELYIRYNNLIVETDAATYRWGYTLETDKYENIPQKEPVKYSIIHWIDDNYFSTIGVHMYKGSEYELKYTDLPLDPIKENNSMHNLSYNLFVIGVSAADSYNIFAYNPFFLINDKLYGINSETGKYHLCDKAFFEQNSTEN